MPEYETTERPIPAILAVTEPEALVAPWETTRLRDLVGTAREED